MAVTGSLDVVLGGKPKVRLSKMTVRNGAMVNDPRNDPHSFLLIEVRSSTVKRWRAEHFVNASSVKDEHLFKVN